MGDDRWIDGWTVVVNLDNLLREETLEMFVAHAHPRKFEMPPDEHSWRDVDRFDLHTLTLGISPILPPRDARDAPVADMRVANLRQTRCLSS